MRVLERRSHAIYTEDDKMIYIGRASRTFPVAYASALVSSGHWWSCEHPCTDLKVPSRFQRQYFSIILPHVAIAENERNGEGALPARPGKKPAQRSRAVCLDRIHG